MAWAPPNHVALLGSSPQKDDARGHRLVDNPRMADPAQSEEGRILAEALSHARRKRDDLRRELDAVERSITEMERKLRAIALGAEPAPARASSAWDRAVQAMRRGGAARQPPPHAAAAVRAEAEPQARTESAPVLERTAPACTTSEPVVQREPERLPAAREPVKAEPKRERASGDVPGPCFMHAVQADDRLAPQQREALRGVYERFVAGWRTRPADGRTAPADIALDEDPALARGQREALRTMLDRFLKKTTR